MIFFLNETIGTWSKWKNSATSLSNSSGKTDHGQSKLPSLAGGGEGMDNEEWPEDIKKQYKAIYKDWEGRAGCFFQTMKPRKCGNNGWI